MSIQNVSNAPTTEAPAKAEPMALKDLPALPNNVVDHDGKLVDNRWKLQLEAFGNASLASLQAERDEVVKYNEDAKAHNDKLKDTADTPAPAEGYSWKSPFNFIGGIFTTVGNLIKSAFVKTFSYCGYCQETDEANAAAKADQPQPKVEGQAN